MATALINNEYTSDYEISLLYFPDYDNSTREQLMNVMHFFHKIGDSSRFFEYIVSFFGALLNTFHLIILTRSSMMTSSTNVLLIGIALCDLFCMLISIKNNLVIDVLEDSCTPPSSLFKIYLDWTITCLRDDFRRCSAWLGVSMTFVRYLLIRFLTESKKFSKPSVGFHVIVSLFLASTFLSIFFFFKYDFAKIGMWHPDKKCPGYSESESLDVYARNNSLFFTFSKGIIADIFLFVNGILSKLIPCLLLPVFTVLIIVELRKAERSRQSVLNEPQLNTRNDRTTSFVIFMAVTFFISELPTGLVYVFQALYDGVAGFFVITTDVTYLCNAIFTFNASIHCIICFSMSSQYRNNVFQLLRVRRKCSSLSVVPTNLNSTVSTRPVAMIKID